MTSHNRKLRNFRKKSINWAARLHVAQFVKIYRKIGRVRAFSKNGYGVIEVVFTESLHSPGSYFLARLDAIHWSSPERKLVEPAPDGAVALARLKEKLPEFQGHRENRRISPLLQAKIKYYENRKS